MNERSNYKTRTRPRLRIKAYEAMRPNIGDPKLPTPAQADSRISSARTPIDHHWNISHHPSRTIYSHLHTRAPTSVKLIQSWPRSGPEEHAVHETGASHLSVVRYHIRVSCNTITTAQMDGLPFSFQARLIYHLRRPFPVRTQSNSRCILAIPLFCLHSHDSQGSQVCGGW